MRFFKAAISAIALTAALAQPAAALEEHRFNNTQTDGTHSIAQHGFWQIHASGDGTADLAFECFANGAPLATGIGFTACYLEGEDGARYTPTDIDANPGFVTATAGAVLDARAQRHRICVQTNAFFGAESEFYGTELACSRFE
jgi:hypothetical protein